MRKAMRVLAVSSLAAAAVAAVLGAGRATGGMVRPTVRSDPGALSRRIDEAIARQLAAEKIKPSPRADDAEFLRRVYLDITGVIPPADKAREFLDSPDSDKRTRLVEELLASPNYGRHSADTWQALLVPRSSDNRRLQVEPLVSWLQERFNGNMPWNQFVAELLTASGPQDKNGAVTFFLANSSADKATDAVCRLFLGVQLQCAQCHNHPFTRWKQDEYWGMAAFFTKVQADRVQAAVRQGNSPGIREVNSRRAQKNLPESAKMLPPRFFQGEQPKVGQQDPYRPVLASWLTAAENPYFARAMVNRVWAQFFGRGLVNPIDDMHEGHPPTHPELFQDLTRQFAATFDVKDLIRAICNSETYQRTSKPLPENEDDTTLFSHMTIKPLTPEQLFDSLAGVVGQGAREAARGKKAAPQGKGPGGNTRAQFVAFFSTDDGSDPTEYQGGIPQALRLMNHQQMNNTAILAPLLKAGLKPQDILDRLYLATLSRRPTATEQERLARYVADNGGDARKAYADILWALLNSSEFTLNH
jgi:hypothetical protein